MTRVCCCLLLTAASLLLRGEFPAPPRAAAFRIVAPEVTDGLNLRLPAPGNLSVRLLTPTLLEITSITTRAANPPDPAQFSVTVDHHPLAVQAVGFRHGILYAPFNNARDLRIDNRCYLQLVSPVLDGQSVVVTNPDATLWSSSLPLVAAADPLRLSPAIHINGEGYELDLPKQAMIGAFLGSLGEMPAPPSDTFTLIDPSGNTVFQGTLTPRKDVGFASTPLPYQAVREADFSAFTTPGTYRLFIPGFGASQPFRIGAGMAMNFARLYALGLYQQRCGRAVELPFSRFTHNACHTLPATLQDNPSTLIDVSGGHHDAGDYGKYTINSAQLIHSLVFAADAFPGAGALDNLGIPESGDGRSDLLQEAKIEADFLRKMQAADGGFHFLVHPRGRPYEIDASPDHGDPQTIWPVNTSATAAATAALAQISSSPLFRRQFPAEAAACFQCAQRGWRFLTAAIQTHGRDAAYQRLTHYGDVFGHDDELAWAACEMFAATGDPAYQTQLIAWYDPASPATRRWTWWRLFEGYGCAARSFAFAARTGRLSAGQLDAAYLAKCEAEIAAAGNDALARSSDSAYGTAFDHESKRAATAGWYFSTDRAFDLAAAYQLNPNEAYLTAFLTNLNYEGGCNPLNVAFITGIGSRRPREIVSQQAHNDWAVLPPSGLPLGNLRRNKNSSFPLYDHWSDRFDVTTEATVANQARSLAGIAWLAARTPVAAQPWKPVPAQITVSVHDQAVTATLTVPNLDLSNAEIVWEAQDQPPTLRRATYTFTPTATGRHWIEAEAHWPDGRRVAAAASFNWRSPLPLSPP